MYEHWEHIIWEQAHKKAHEVKPTREIWLCPKMKMDYVPFALYAALSYHVYDLKAISKTERNKIYIEYQRWCWEMGIFQWEHWKQCDVSPYHYYGGA
jgi:hypothetical protein